MKNLLNRLWLQLLSSHRSDIEQIAVLQQNAANCRAAFAQETQTASPLITSTADSRSRSRKKMEAAEVAYRLALQRWENKQSRQKMG